MKKLTIIICACLALGACTRYLDIKPYGKTIPTTAEEFSELLNSTLNKIDEGEEDVIGTITSSIEFEYFCDNLEANITKYPQGSLIPLYIGSRLNGMQSRYSNIYQTIRDCNIIIGYMEDRTSETALNVLGTAYATRGVCYYQLIRMFCDPCSDNPQGQLGMPNVTVFDMEAKVTRSSLKSTIELAESDFKTALNYHINDDIYRFNDDVVKGYLARLYFWSRDWNNALKYADEVLVAHPLLDINAYKAMMDEQTMMTGNTIFKANRINTSSTNTANSGAKSYLSARPISKRFIDLFAEGDKDVRYNMSIGNKRATTKNVFASLRSAEMCLIAAESNYHLGNEDKALTCINNLRRNRISAYTDLKMETLPAVNTNEYIKTDVYGKPLTPLLQTILNERRKELFMENGDRWFELKRNGRPEFWAAKNGLKYTTKEYMYTFPIPVEDIELNPGLVQNPGYEDVE